MNTTGTTVLLVVAGCGLAVQNLLMARIANQTSSLLMALTLNSAIGFALLAGLLLWRSGPSSIAALAQAAQPWFILPGLLGTLFVFASVTGYRQFGATATIALLVASQLLAGLAADAVLMPNGQRLAPTTVLGAGLLIAGTVLVLRRHL